MDSYGGTIPRQVGRTKFTYDKAGRVTQTVTKRLSKKPLVKHFYYDHGTQPVGYEDSDHPGVGWRYLYDGACRRVGKEQINTTTGEVTSRVMFLHEGDILFGEYHAVNVMDPHMVGSAVLWPTDPGTREILGQITINTNTSITDSVTGHGDGNGYYSGGYSGDTGGNNNADDPYNQHNNPHGGYSDSPYNHNDSTTDGAGGVLGWPQQRVDAVFYSMVCDLAGAPKELIDPMTGEVVGYATYTLFGKRQWAGMVSTPLLFTGQYEDTESGWVYNRFRYYDPHAGVYNAQDPLGLLANLGTAQGYVTNPVTWVDVLGLKKCNMETGHRPRYIKGVPRKNPAKTRATALEGANPTKSTVNCVRCVSAWAARKLGYDVYAAPEQFSKLGGYPSPAEYAASFWKDAHQQPPQWYSGSWPDRGFTLKDAQHAITESMPEGSYGFIRFGLPSASHVMGWERIGAETRFVDPQFPYIDANEFYSMTRPDTIKWTRIDDKIPTQRVFDIIKGVF